MYSDRDFRLGEGLPPNAAGLTQDLELNILFDAMAAGDSFLREVVSNAVLASVHDPAAIIYRQNVLADCLASPNIIREIYAAAVEAIESEKKVWSLMWERDAQSALHRSTEVLRLCVRPLHSLQQIATNDIARFNSQGFQRFFSMITTELDDEYLHCVEEQIESLEFTNGVLMSAGFGIDGKSNNFILRKAPETKQSWLERVRRWVVGLAGTTDATFAYEVDERDEAGFRTLGDLRGQGIRHVASALTQSTDHILSFFRVLRMELGFYVGCLNLRKHMIQKGEPVCFPKPVPHGNSELQCKGLRVFYVTHLFALADGFYRAGMGEALFLRAERLEDGRRTFRLLEGEPLPTSFGEDLYRQIFSTIS
jgi:hypothetical protein